MNKKMHGGLFALSLALFRYVPIKGTLLRILEQSVFATLLLFAFSDNITLSSMPYAPYLLLGLAPWFYLEEIIMGAPKNYNDFSPMLRMHDKNASWLPFLRAFTALPTLLLWQLIAIAYILLTAGDTVTLCAIPYYMLCNIINAVAQGQMAIALLPIIENIAGEGFSLMTTILFWSTPIVWPISQLRGVMLFMTQLNPLYYIAETGRNIFYSGYDNSSANAFLFFLSVGVVFTAGYVLHNVLCRVAHGGKIFSLRVDI